MFYMLMEKDLGVETSPERVETAVEHGLQYPLHPHLDCIQQCLLKSQRIYQYLHHPKSCPTLRKVS